MAKSKKGQRSEPNTKTSLGVAIEQLIGMGMDNAQVFNGLKHQFPQVIENDNVRKRVCEEMGIAFKDRSGQCIVPFDFIMMR